MDVEFIMVSVEIIEVVILQLTFLSLLDLTDHSTKYIAFLFPIHYTNPGILLCSNFRMNGMDNFGWLSIPLLKQMNDMMS